MEALSKKVNGISRAQQRHQAMQCDFCRERHGNYEYQVVQGIGLPNEQLTIWAMHFVPKITPTTTHATQNEGTIRISPGEIKAITFTWISTATPTSREETEPRGPNAKVHQHV